MELIRASSSLGKTRAAPEGSKEMKKTLISAALFALCSVLICLSTGCGAIRGVSAAVEFTNAADHFAIRFPGGSSDIETEQGKTKNKYIPVPANVYSKNFDNHSENYRSYEVNVFNTMQRPPKGDLTERDILGFGLNGWDGEPEAVTKEVTINGMNALDCVRTVSIGPASMTFREVVFWSDKDKTLYVLRIAGAKRDTVNTKEADDFINSFRMT